MKFGAADSTNPRPIRQRHRFPWSADKERSTDSEMRYQAFHIQKQSPSKTPVRSRSGSNRNDDWPYLSGSSAAIDTAGDLVLGGQEHIAEKGYGLLEAHRLSRSGPPGEELLRLP